MDKSRRTGIPTFNTEVMPTSSGPVRAGGGRDAGGCRGGAGGGRDGIMRDLAGRGSRGRSESIGLQSVSDNALVRRLERLRGCERNIVVRILHHLHEAEKRSLYLRRGYCSLFEFCTEHLKYSRSAAGRRIAAARALGDFPVLKEELLSGSITLYNLALVSRILTVENFSEIVPRIRNRSSRDVEALASGYRPKEMFRDRIRPVSVFLPEPPFGTDGPPSAEKARCTDGVHCGDGPRCTDGVHCGEGSRAAVHPSGTGISEKEGPVTPGAGSDISSDLKDNIKDSSSNRNDSGFLPGLSAPARGRMKVLRKYRLEFAADPRFIEKLERTKALLSTKFPAGIGLEELFEHLMDEYIGRHSPEARENRRKGRLQRKMSEAGTPRAGSPASDPRTGAPSCRGDAATATGSCTSLRRDAPARRNGNASALGSPDEEPSHERRPAAAPPDNMRAIPRRIRDEVYVRDGGRCTFRGPDGRRCGSRHDLQIDHIIPRALGGDSSPENLRLLCGRHNRLEAERVFGHPLPRRSRNISDRDSCDPDRNDPDRCAPDSRGPQRRDGDQGGKGSGGGSG